ncbi:uncharacterized protein LOC122022786 [Zingiber officinale]|uniref:uncharacterized protein LOC122022786 n=1 Tax=Zingiber officinale TaxID=94328 RepID=UPI001C4D0C3A|nr:uncharacterized protein LOC122022786 [Zingiber officinale]
MVDKLLKDYATPFARGVQSSITRPPIDADNLEIKPAVIHMVQQNQFRGGPHEDPNHHLELFYEICGTMKVNEVPPESKFLDKFYLPNKTAHMRNLIASFKQIDLESLFEAWNWFNIMQRQCPHYGLEKWLVLHTFYNGINYHTKVSLDSTAGGALMNKSLDEVEEIIENVALNHHQWASKRSSGAFSGNQMKASGKFKVDAFTLMSAKRDALTKKFEAMGSNTTNAIVCACDICRSYNQRQNNLYSNTYNPGWRNHPNFSYRNNQDQGAAHQVYQHGQQAHQQQQPTQLSRIEKMLEEALSEHKEMRSEIKQLTQRLENSEKHQKMQDIQIAQIAQSVSRA